MSGRRPPRRGTPRDPNPNPKTKTLPNSRSQPLTVPPPSLSTSTPSNNNVSRSIPKSNAMTLSASNPTSANVNTTSARSHRTYQPGKLHMELMPSLSRSSGMEKDGDSLRDLKVQGEYREFIQGKLTDYWKRYPLGRDVKDAEEVKRREEVERNLLILFRKLREGLMATNRKDQFALEVYETSLRLSVLFNSPFHTTSIIGHLLPHLYLFPASALPLSPHSRTSALLSCLHFLVTEYPSQSRYHEHLYSLRGANQEMFLPPKSKEGEWLARLTRDLRMKNYASLEGMTRPGVLSSLVPGAAAVPDYGREGDNDALPTGHRSLPLALHALCTLVNGLRNKVRESTWAVLRSAYRELRGGSANGGGSIWLCKTLTLQPVTTSNGSSEGGKAEDELVSEWMEGRRVIGQVRVMEGSRDRWVMVKDKL